MFILFSLFCVCAVNKQLADKERVAAALENSSLLEVVNQCLSTRTIWASSSSVLTDNISTLQNAEAEDLFKTVTHDANMIRDITLTSLKFGLEV